MKAGDMIYPILRTNTVTGQISLPFWGSIPALLIRKELYESNDPSDCQSDGEDWRWIVLHDGDISWWTETLIGQFFESR